jgi:MFS family permease
MSATTAIKDAGPIPLRRNRDFRLLLSGFSVSMLGSRVSAIAYPLLVLALTGSPVAAGWACFATIAPSILVYLPAGALVDRWDPRRAMLLSELGRGIAIAAIVVTLIFHWLSVPGLVILGASEQILEVFSVLAERRLVRSVVEPAQAASALARSEARAHLVVLVGRPLGALLFGLGRIVPFVADILSFGVSIGALKRLRIRREASHTERAMSGHLAHEIGEGFLWLRQNPFAGVALPLTAGTTLIVQALIMVFLAEAHMQHLPPVTIGLVLAASGAGGALGSVAGPWLFSRIGYSLLKIQMGAWSVMLALLALSGGRSFLIIAAAMAILGLTGALGNIAIDTFVIRNAAETMLARLMSVDRLTSFGAVALGPLLGGVLVERYGTQYSIWALLVMTMLLLVAAVAAPLPPGGRDVRVAARTSSLRPTPDSSSATPFVGVPQ